MPLVKSRWFRVSSLLVMGNRSSSPKRRTPSSAAKPTSVAADAGATTPNAAVPVDTRAIATVSSALSSRPLPMPLGAATMTPRVLAAVNQDPTQQPQAHHHQWQHVSSTVEALSVFNQTIHEQRDRQRKKLERQAIVNQDPELFFALHRSALDPTGGSGDAAADSDDVTMLDTIGLQYTTALLLKSHGQFAAAAQLLQQLLNKPKTSVAMDARVHLAQCLLSMDPTLETPHSQQVLQLLQVVCSDQGIVALDPSLAKQATELLAHYHVAHGNYIAALAALGTLSPRQQSLSGSPQSTSSLPLDVRFQIACCHHLLSGGDSLQSLEAPDSSTVRHLMIEADAILAGPQ